MLVPQEGEGKPLPFCDEAITKLLIYIDTLHILIIDTINAFNCDKFNTFLGLGNWTMLILYIL